METHVSQHGVAQGELGPMSTMPEQSIYRVEDDAYDVVHECRALCDENAVHGQVETAATGFALVLCTPSPQYPPVFKPPTARHPIVNLCCGIRVLGVAGIPGKSGGQIEEAAV